MFSVSKITALSEQVGFKQPISSDVPILEADLLTSKSGLIVNDSSFLKLEMIKDAQDAVDISDSQFSEYLREKIKESVINVCNSVFNQSSFIERDLMFRYANNLVNTETLPIGFVGYKLDLTDCNDTAFELKKVLLTFEGTGDIELILWNTGQTTPLETKTITIASTNQLEVLDWRLDNVKLTYKGDYYIGYNTTGLSVKPFKRDYENSSIVSCFKSLSFTKVFVDGHDTIDLFDLTKTDSISEDIGINLDVSVFKDFTDLIINNDFLFAKAIYLTAKIVLLSEIANSIRSNRNKRIGKENLIQINAEIEGVKGDNVINITGLRPRLLGTYKHLRKEILEIREGYFGEEKQFQTVTMK